MEIPSERASALLRERIHYRPDVDGLRAIAVLIVVFYHYQIWPWTGGFVGVDVFFVISGYPISSIIYPEILEHRFSILEFYSRRIRRIFPALGAALLFAAIVSVFILFPLDLKNFGKGLFATALFSSNFEFWQEAGYFDRSALSKPLLHTWSLAVEEQFYLFFPPLLLLARSTKTNGTHSFTRGSAYWVNRKASRAELSARQHFVNQTIARLHNRFGVRVIDPSSILCKEFCGTDTRCIPTAITTYGAN